MRIYPGMRMTATALLWLGSLAALPARAAEMLVEGEVVQVVPLDGAGGVSHPPCQPPRPAGDPGLIELLEWDLRARCPATAAAQQTAGYQVYYRWDGRTYSRIMDRPPGDTVTLRVRLQ